MHTWCLTSTEPVRIFRDGGGGGGGGEKGRKGSVEVQVSKHGA